MEDISPVIEYQEKIQDLNIDLIIPNVYNPRERFNEEEEDELIESILNKGILNPIIVYRQKNDNRYVILDGERRYRASKKLNIKHIPARILVREPNVLESLSLMFHIQNVRQDWTEFAISITIKRIIDELGKKLPNLTNGDIKYLSEITSLSQYRVRKYLKFLDYPDEVIQMFLFNEVNQRKGEGPDPDILLEMHKPISDIREIMPSIFEEFSEKEIIDICIEKKETGVIKTNKEFRLISKSLTAAKKDEISITQLEKNLIAFFKTKDFAPDKVYRQSAEVIYQFKAIKKNSESFLKELQEFDFDTLDEQKKEEVLDILEQIVKLINKNS